MTRALVVLLLAACLVTGEELRPARNNSLARARVVIVENPKSVVSFTPVPALVDEMFNRGLTTLRLKDSTTDAWRSILNFQETVGLKVFSSPGPTSGTRTAVVEAVVKSLLAAGFPPSQIVIWDKHLSDLRLAGYGALAERYGVQIAGSAEEGFDPKASYESSLLGTLVWGDLEFGKKGENLGRKSYVSKLLTRRLNKVINISPLLNHNDAMVSGSLYSLAMGSVDNNIRFESVNNSSAQLSEAVPEIYALPDVGDRVVLSIVDALICQYQGEEGLLLHRSASLGQLRLSTDPVALDVLSVQELDRQRQRAKVPPVKINWQIFTNASLLDLGTSDLRLIDAVKVECRQN